jgi:hypothetical protein
MPSRPVSGIRDTAALLINNQQNRCLANFGYEVAKIQRSENGSMSGKRAEVVKNLMVL